MRVIKVKSISDYLTKIKKYNLTDSICRGESSYHESINSGLFRNNYPRKVSSITQQYYNLVGNSLSELQRKHFVAFSQHYGIPTNLIDFSTSPLVALYFACQNTEKSSNGYVHFIKENKLIDISDKIDFINGKNYFGQILAFSENNLDLTVDLIRKIEAMCLINFDEDTDFLKSAISQYASMAISAQFAMENEDYYPRIDFCEIDFDTDYNIIIQKVLAQSRNVFGKAECAFLDRVFSCFNNSIDTFDIDIIKCIISFLVTVKIVYWGIDPYTKWRINDLHLPFYFVYTPPQIVSRIEHQSSIFIQQQYLDYSLTPAEYIFDCVFQKITPDRTFMIQEKAEILKELDRLGVNEKTIYNDYDSVARYVKRKVLGSD